MSRLYLIYLAALLAATLAAPVPAAVDRDGSQAYYEQAMEFFRAAQFPEATIQLKNAVQRDPKNLAARIMLGKVLLCEGQPLAAIKELEMAQAMGGDENLILVPLAQAYIDVAEHEHVITGFVAEGHLPAVDGELYILQAEAYLQLGSRKPAEEAYLSAGVLMPIDPRPILGRARMQLAKNRPKRARRLLDEALALAPESYGVWIFKAIMHRDFGEYKDAIQAFERVLELRPTSVRALTARAAMWMDLGQIEKAKADITQAAGLNNDSLETIYLRTLILFREGKAEEARQVLRASADEIRQIKEGYREKFPNTKLMLGVVAYFERNYDEAIAHLRAYLATIPQHPGALRYLASAYLSLGETQEVIRLLNPNPQTKLPNDPITLSILGEAYRSSGQFDKAESFFAAALKLAPNAAGLGVRLAMSRLDAGQAAAATDNLEKLAARFPDFKEAQIQLARVYVKTGNVERAAQVAADMAVRFRDDGEVHNVVGATFLAAGQTARARNHMRLAAELEPDLILPKLNLARLARAEGHMASAQAQYRTVLEQFPHHAIAALELTDLLLREGNHEEALDHIRRVLETDPLLFQAHELRLKAMFAKREDPEEIRTSLYDLTKTFPDEARASLVAGKGYRQLGDLADAKVQFRRTVESARFETELLFKTANQQFGIGDNSGALWSLTKAEQASPKHKGVGVLKAAVLTELEDFRAAEETIQALYDNHGAKADILTVHGDFYMAREQHGAAVDVYHQAFELAPSRKTIRTSFRAMVVADDIARATTLMESWIAEHPRDFGSKHLYAQMLVREKEWVKAQAIYEGLMADGIEDAVLLNNLAASYQYLGDDRALPIAEAAYKKAPGNPSIIDTYGWILTENGKVDEGLALLREAYARASTSPEIRYHIGLALARLGRDEEAAEEVEAALAESYSFPAVEAARALLDRLKASLN